MVKVIGDPVNGSDPSWMMCLDALDPFSSGFSQCWSSGYSTLSRNVQFQFNPVQGLKGGVNFIEGFGNSQLQTVNFVSSLVSVHTNVRLCPLFHSTNPFVQTDFQAGQNVATVYGYVIDPQAAALTFVASDLYFQTFLMWLKM